MQDRKVWWQEQGVALNTETAGLSLQDRLTLFLSKARQLNAHAELLSMLDNMPDPTMTVYDALIEDLVEIERAAIYARYSPTGAHPKFTDYRTVIDAAQLCAAFKFYFREDQEFVEERERNHTQNQQRRQENQFPISQEQVDMFKTVGMKMLESTDVRQVVNALCLFSGRRPYECAVSGQFRVHRHPVLHANQYVYFRGLRKTGENDERARAVVEIPVLIDPVVFCNAAKRLHTLPGYPKYRTFHPRVYAPIVPKSAEAFMQSQGSRLRDTCKTFFKPIVPDMKAHLTYDITPQSLRKFFEAMVAADWDHQGTSESAFIAEILAHSDLTNTGSYLDVYVHDAPPPRFKTIARLRKDGLYGA